MGSSLGDSFGFERMESAKGELASIEGLLVCMTTCTELLGTLYDLEGFGSTPMQIQFAPMQSDLS